MAWSLLTMSEKTGLYCNMSALTGSDRERYNQLIRKLEAARIEIQELADGYAFRLRNELISLAEVGEWISYESKCCPFFGFEVQLERDNGPLWLKLKGQAGIKPFIRAEFGIR
jgi:hypothetical protein